MNKDLAVKPQLVFRVLWIGVLMFAVLPPVSAHPGGHGGPEVTRDWTNQVTGQVVRGGLLSERGGTVAVESADGRTVRLALRDLVPGDRRCVEQHRERAWILNATDGPVRLSPPRTVATAPLRPKLPLEVGLGGLSLLLVVALLRARAATVQPVARRRQWIAGTAVLAALATVTPVTSNTAAPTPAVAASFAPFKQVKTRWDASYLYVESNGLPEHLMMRGIRSWQQQVPLPQPYTGENAWQIPLHPVPAEQPISARSGLFRGAIALAVNGVPIFNALNNRGVDSNLEGELDEWGGHCGRADDYHYHVAPLQLQAQAGIGKPIAYALDGYPLFGLTEPDGSPVGKLDELNGHLDKEIGYHYHGTKTYPYINGGLKGVVRVRGDQVEPQPRAFPVRAAGQPLRGAVITGFKATGDHAYSLVFTWSNASYTLNYRVGTDGTYTFEHVSPGDEKQTYTYHRQTRPGR